MAEPFDELQAELKELERITTTAGTPAELEQSIEAVEGAYDEVMTVAKQRLTEARNSH